MHLLLLKPEDAFPFLEAAPECRSRYDVARQLLKLLHPESREKRTDSTRKQINRKYVNDTIVFIDVLFLNQ